VAGKASYGQTHHGYPATDIFAACGTPYVAPVDGVVLELSRADTWDPKINAGPTRGGLNISILGDDGIRYYAAHFASIEPGVAPQTRVTAGQKLAVVGRTGDTTACHVHFGISPLCQRLGDWWIRRGVIWPWPYLDAWHSGQMRPPAPEITAWQAANGCPATPLVEP
jgi:murein DD-endopeptidase MepM/ murein hydrolase activator NlpD